MGSLVTADLTLLAFTGTFEPSVSHTFDWFKNYKSKTRLGWLQPSKSEFQGMTFLNVYKKGLTKTGVTWLQLFYQQAQHPADRKVG